MESSSGCHLSVTRTSYDGGMSVIETERRNESFSVVPKVLVADDEKDLVSLISYHLHKKGFQTLSAFDGSQAWSLIVSERPALTILDLMMPEIDGWDICKMVRQHREKHVRDMGLLMLTARGSAEDRARGLALGADDYLTKPFSINELLLRVEKMIHRRTVVSELDRQITSLQRQAEASQQSLQGLVHDLKNPLIAVGSLAQLLMKDYGRNEREKILNLIYDNSQKMTRWVNDILILSSLRSGAPAKSMQEVNLVTLVRRTVEVHKESAAAKQIKMTVETPDSIPKVQGHASLLERVFDNLISNAIKFTPAHGKVKISLIPYLGFKNEPVVEFCVADTGAGIRPEDRDRIFEPFYRGKEASFTEGLGLGLSIVKQTVDLHHGRILLDTEAQSGSTFSVLLPVGAEGKEVSSETQQECHVSVTEL
jgi:two-component system, sensor histidine kinase and response regulator